MIISPVGDIHTDTLHPFRLTSKLMIYKKKNKSSKVTEGENIFKYMMVVTQNISL